MNFTELHQAGAEAYFAGRFKEADRQWKRALKLEPRAISAWSNRGAVLHALGQYHPALVCYEEALKLDPKYAEAWSNRAMTLLEINRYVEALQACERALEINPDYAEALVNRGAVERALGRFEEALATADKVLLLAPDMQAAWTLRGQTLIGLSRWREAQEIFEHMLTHAPDLNVCIEVGVCRQHYGDHRGAIECFDRALAYKPDCPEVISNKIFSLDFLPEMTTVEQQRARRQWWRQIGVNLRRSYPQRAVHRNANKKKITLGYVSADFRHHSAATAFWPVISHHDKTQFEIILYSFSTRRDDLTAEFMRVADQFVDVTQMSTPQMAKRVRADGVDILVDLSGHSAGNRLDVFSLKPAPVQVTAWGYGVGTGLPTIDWLFSDPVLIPKAERHLYAEKIYDLPCSLFSALPAFAERLRRGEPPVLANGFITFGCFNRIMKMSDESVALWAKILHAVPASRLLLKDGSFDAAQSRNDMHARFASACALNGLQRDLGDRISFLGQTTREAHLAAFNAVDIALDPFPHNGGVSTWEPLHMGVPVITLMGTTAPGRISGAILTALKMQDLIAKTREHYVQMAVDLAGKSQQLIDMRRELSGNIMTSPAGNAVLYTRAVEQAYSAFVLNGLQRD